MVHRDWKLWRAWKNGDRREVELAGVAELADLSGLSKQRIDDLFHNRKGYRREHPFPQVLARLASGPVFDRDECVAWFEAQAARKAVADSKREQHRRAIEERYASEPPTWEQRLRAAGDTDWLAVIKRIAEGPP